MLLELFRSLADGFPALNVFNYLTLRAVLAALTSMGIGFALGPWMIARLKNLHFGQAVRTDGPKTHLVKDGTPTMGGALILFAITVSTLLWADLSNRFIWVVLFVTLGYGSIGWIDDYRKVVHHNPKGMSAREKFSWQSVIGLAAAFYLVFALSVPAGGTLTETIAGWVEAGFPLDISSNLHLLIPCFKDIALPLGLVGFMVFTYVVIVGSSNAVNLTDGLDGLAILPSVMVGGALGIFAYVVGRPDYAGYLIFPYIPGAGELVVIAGGLLGAGLAFLWYNAHPAQVFMGDVGALALGGCHGRHHPSGTRARRHGRHLRRGDALRHDSDGLLPPLPRQAHLPDGSRPSSLRAQGLEGDPGRHALLDHHDDPRAHRPFDAQDPLTGRAFRGV